MSAPDVSLMICVGQTRPEWLEQAVESALDDDTDLELVVVDDGNDVPVASSLAVEDSRIRHVRIEHGGQPAARDAGIAAARGRYLRFLDADDVVVADSTARLLRLLGGRADLVAYGAVTVCDEELRPLSTISSTLRGDVVVPCLLGRFDVRHVAMLMPREVVVRAGSWSSGLDVSADWDFVLRVLEHAQVVGTTDPAVLYRRHRSSVQGAASIDAGARARERIIQRHLERNPQTRGTRVERAAWAGLHLDRALAYAAVGDPRASFDRLRRSARLAPLRTLWAAGHAARLLVARRRRQSGAHRRP